MKFGHCTELLLELISHLDQDQLFDKWDFEHSFRLADTWFLKNPTNSEKYIQIKIHGSGLNIDIYIEGNPNKMCFWLSSADHLPQLDAFIQEYLFTTVSV